MGVGCRGAAAGWLREEELDVGGGGTSRPDAQCGAVEWRADQSDGPRAGRRL